MWRPLLVSFASLTLTTGLLYPLLCTGLAQSLFPHQASGSLLTVDGVVRGATLIGQATADPAYFWVRPSTTASFPTNALQSGGSTLAASNPALAAQVDKRLAHLVQHQPGPMPPVPQDLVTASASGLDPHISLQAALWQVPRVAAHRRMERVALEKCIAAHTQKGWLGPDTVNVFLLNAALDGAH